MFPRWRCRASWSCLVFGLILREWKVTLNCVLDVFAGIKFLADQLDYLVNLGFAEALAASDKFSIVPFADFFLPFCSSQGPLPMQLAFRERSLIPLPTLQECYLALSLKLAID